MCASLLDDIPPHLDERIVARTDPSTCRPIGQHATCVIYWMRCAMRAHDNPALDLAIWASKRLDLPLLVCQQVDSSVEGASDRLHTFVLEGAKDVASECLAHHILYRLHLREDDDAPDVIEALGAHGAALIVTDEMPIAPYRVMVHEMAESISVPLWRVDASCIVPMPTTAQAYEYVYDFRRATEAARQDRISQRWEDAVGTKPTPPEFEEWLEAFSARHDIVFLEPETMSIPQVVGRCAIDHSIAPLSHTKGGTAKGYMRWSTFSTRHISRYKAPHDQEATRSSWLLPYLHFGMISPFKLARQTRAIEGEGGEKFLDDLTVWRDLSYHFCHHTSDDLLFTLSALPDWARHSLTTAKRDEGGEIYHDILSLEQARTGDDAWDAMQTSLRMHGELDDEARGVWGKAILSWRASADDALQTALTLTHRFSLGARDPRHPRQHLVVLWPLRHTERRGPHPRHCTPTPDLGVGSKARVCRPGAAPPPSSLRRTRRHHRRRGRRTRRSDCTRSSRCLVYAL